MQKVRLKLAIELVKDNIEKLVVELLAIGLELIVFLDIVVELLAIGLELMAFLDIVVELLAIGLELMAFLDIIVVERETQTLMELEQELIIGTFSVLFFFQIIFF